MNKNKKKIIGNYINIPITRLKPSLSRYAKRVGNISISNEDLESFFKFKIFKEDQMMKLNSMAFAVMKKLQKDELFQRRVQKIIFSSDFEDCLDFAIVLDDGTYFEYDSERFLSESYSKADDIYRGIYYYLGYDLRVRNNSDFLYLYNTGREVSDGGERNDLLKIFQERK
jgi:hypothetical protein